MNIDDMLTRTATVELSVGEMIALFSASPTLDTDLGKRAWQTAYDKIIDTFVKMHVEAQPPQPEQGPLPAQSATKHEVEWLRSRIEELENNGREIGRVVANHDKRLARVEELIRVLPGAGRSDPLIDSVERDQRVVPSGFNATARYPGPDPLPD